MPSSAPLVTVAPRCWIPPTPSNLEPSFHPFLEAATKEVDEYFFQNWPFRSEKARAKYTASGFTRAACSYYPKALERRAVVAGKLFSFCFLIDDIVDNLSYDDGAQFTASLMSILRHTFIPDKSQRVQYVLYEIWTEMCNQDKELAEATVDPMIQLWFSQTDGQAERDAQTSLSAYLDYRERDFGAEWAFAVLRFCSGLKIEATELASVRLLERNAANHLGVVNDCLSWEKEVLAMKTGHKEGAALCSAVQVVSLETGLQPEGSRRALWAMVLEWELAYQQLVEQQVLVGCSAELKQYMDLVKHTMSGNLAWCMWTQRYKVIVDSV